MQRHGSASEICRIFLLRVNHVYFQFNREVLYFCIFVFLYSVILYFFPLYFCITVFLYYCISVFLYLQPPTQVLEQKAARLELEASSDMMDRLC